MLESPASAGKGPRFTQRDHGRQCAFCQKLDSDSMGACAGPMRASGVAGDAAKGDSAVFFHEKCAIWSPKCYWRDKREGGPIAGVPAELERGRRLRCMVCKKTGATVGCYDAHCQRSFHYPCALQAKCYMDEDKYEMLCPHHGAKLPVEDVGRKLRVWWPLDKKWYTGRVAGFELRSQKHEIEYEDRMTEALHLSKETFEWLSPPKSSPQKPGSTALLVPPHIRGSITPLSERLSNARSSKSPESPGDSRKRKASALQDTPADGPPANFSPIPRSHLVEITRAARTPLEPKLDERGMRVSAWKLPPFLTSAEDDDYPDGPRLAQRDLVSKKTAKAVAAYLGKLFQEQSAALVLKGQKPSWEPFTLVLPANITQRKVEPPPPPPPKPPPSAVPAKRQPANGANRKSATPPLGASNNSAKKRKLGDGQAVSNPPNSSPKKAPKLGSKGTTSALGQLAKRPSPPKTQPKAAKPGASPKLQTVQNADGTRGLVATSPADRQKAQKGTNSSTAPSRQSNAGSSSKPAQPKHSTAKPTAPIGNSAGLVKSGFPGPSALKDASAKPQIIPLKQGGYKVPNKLLPLPHRSALPSPTSKPWEAPGSKPKVSPSLPKPPSSAFATKKPIPQTLTGIPLKATQSFNPKQARPATTSKKSSASKANSSKKPVAVSRPATAPGAAKQQPPAKAALAATKASPSKAFVPRSAPISPAVVTKAPTFKPPALAAKPSGPIGVQSAKGVASQGTKAGGTSPSPLVVKPVAHVKTIPKMKPAQTAAAAKGPSKPPQISSSSVQMQEGGKTGTKVESGTQAIARQEGRQGGLVGLPANVASSPRATVKPTVSAQTSTPGPKT